MRIVHLVIGGDVAGGQMVALRLARAARQAGHDVSFVSPTSGPFLERLHEEGIEARVIPQRGALDIRALLRLRRHLRDERTDVLHTHTHFAGNVLGRVAARLAGARVLAHMHVDNVFRAHGPGRRAQIAIDNATARLCEHIVAVSEATRAGLLRQGYPAGVLLTVHNGVEPAAAVSPVRVGDGPTILQVARLAAVKGQRELLAAVARLDRRDAVVVLAGEDIEAGGAYRRELEREAARLGIEERVRFLGYRDDVPSLLSGCDVFCLPSRIEGLPLVVLEAMAHGAPVVATAVGGTPELVVDGETGLLVPPGDVPALATALDRLLADPELGRRLGEAGRQRVAERFTAASATQRVLRLYEEPSG